MSKWWCFFGVHELETVDQGPYKVYEWSGRLSATGNYYILRCRCCGAMKRKVLC